MKATIVLDTKKREFYFNERRMDFGIRISIANSSKTIWTTSMIPIALFSVQSVGTPIAHSLPLPIEAAHQDHHSL